MADRVERITNLLALLLESKVPLTLTQITDQLASQYPDNEGSRRTAFERDKAALREVGVPLDTEVIVGGAQAGSSTYWIDRSKYELDDLALDPDEMRALQVAVAAVRTDSSAGRNALLKLGGESSADASAVSAVVPDRPELPTIREAVATRASVTFGYRDELRTVDPWGLLLRGGFWYLVGHDHLRGEKRTFRIDRFDDGGIELGAAGSFDRPASFDPREAFPADPKQIGHAADDGVDAVVRIDASRAASIEREVGADRVTQRHDDGSIDVLVPASNRVAFRSWVLGLLDHAVVLEPGAVRDDVVEWLQAVASS